MPKGQYQRRTGLQVFTQPVPAPDEARLVAAQEQAEAGVAELERVVAQELPKTDSRTLTSARTWESGTARWPSRTGSTRSIRRLAWCSSGCERPRSYA